MNLDNISWTDSIYSIKQLDMNFNGEIGWIRIRTSWKSGPTTTPKKNRIRHKSESDLKNSFLFPLPLQAFIGPSYTQTIQRSNRLVAWVNFITYTVCPENSDPPENIFNIFASENEVYTVHHLLTITIL